MERFQQTLKNWLAAQHPQPATLTELQALLDTFTSYYNTRRPHARILARPRRPGSNTVEEHGRTPGSDAQEVRPSTTRVQV